MSGHTAVTALAGTELPRQRIRAEASLPTLDGTAANTDFYPLFTATEKCYVDNVLFSYKEGTTPAGDFEVVKIVNGTDTGTPVALFDAVVAVDTPVPSTLVPDQLMSCSENIHGDAAAADVALDILVSSPETLRLGPGDRIYIETIALDDIDELHVVVEIITGWESQA